MIKVPQNIGPETTEALNALIAASDKFRDWNSPEIQTLVHATGKLQKADARVAFICRGSLAAICGEVDLVEEYFRKALLLPDTNSTKYEYHIALANAGLYAKAHALGAWLLEPRRGFFPTMWERAISMGQIRAVCKHVADAQRMYPELLDTSFDVVEKADSVMKERGLTDEAIASVLDCMGVVQRAHRIMFHGQLVAALKIMRPPEDPPYLYLSMALDTDVTEVRRMNRELATAVIEQLPNGIFPPGVVAAFSRGHLTELKAAA